MIEWIIRLVIYGILGGLGEVDPIVRTGITLD
jgi:hypothetical protein